MIPIEIRNGGENPTSGSSSIQVHVWVDGREKFPSDVAGTHDGFHSVGDAEFMPALRGHVQKIGGRWVRQAFIIPEGTIMRVHGSRRANFRSVATQASMLIRVRAAAALRKVTMNTLRITDSTFSKVIAAHGRFDVISLEQAKQFGYNPAPLYLDTYTPENIIRVFETEILEEEIRAQETGSVRTIKTQDGTKQMFIRTRTRALEI